MKTFIVDIGNTHTLMGSYVGESAEPEFYFRLRTDTEATEDELYFQIESALKRRNAKINEYKEILVASVVPRLVDTWQSVFEQTTVINEKSPWSFKVDIENPSQIERRRGAQLAAAEQVRPDRASR